MRLYDSNHLMILWNGDKVGSIFTPVNIVCSMLNMLIDVGFWDKPDSLDGYVENHRFIDIFCKSGRFLQYAYIKFSLALDEVIPCSQERDRFIWDNLIYGLCANEDVCNCLKKRFGCRNIHCLDLVYDWQKVQEVFDGMKFDVVVGNPPYNDDLYLDFVMNGYKLSKEYTCMITPAKFIAKDDAQNRYVRDIIYPRILSLVNYKTEKDIFDITEPGGLAYYLCGKDEVSKMELRNVHSSCRFFNTDYEVVLKDGRDNFLPEEIYNLISKLGKCTFKDNISIRRTEFTGEQERGHSYDDKYCIEVCQGSKTGINVLGYLSEDELVTTQGLDKWKCIMSIMPGGYILDKTGSCLGLNVVFKLGANQVPKGSYVCLKMFDNEYEADSFISYCSTKFVKFLFICGICGTTNTYEFFRFVPNQEFNGVLYEDNPLEGYTLNESGEYVDSEGNKHCSLYVKYSLTDEEVNIIESVIRERK